MNSDSGSLCMLKYKNTKNINDITHINNQKLKMTGDAGFNGILVDLQK